MEVQIKELEIPTNDGHSLIASKFTSESRNENTIVITSATGVLQKYYSKFAIFFALRGFVVYTFDYYGIGKSGGSETDLKYNNANAMSWGKNDQTAVVAFAKKENPNTKLTLIGHSIGGQLLGFNTNYHLIDKVILVASQTGYWKHFKGLHTLKMLLFWNVIIPFFTSIFGYFPAKKLGLFENLPKRVVYEWASWGRHPKYLMRSYNKQQHLFDRFKIPLLALSFSKDNYAPKNTVDKLVRLYKNAQVKRVHHEPKAGGKHVKHFGFFKSWAQEPFWEQCLNYILNGNYES